MFAAPLVAAHIKVSALLGSSTPDPSGTGTPSPTVSPTPAPSATSISDGLANVIVDAQKNVQNQVCTKDDFSICGLTLRVTGSQRTGQWLDFILGTRCASRSSSSSAGSCARSCTG